MLVSCSAVLYFQPTNETPLSVLTSKNKDTQTQRVYRDEKKNFDHHHKSLYRGVVLCCALLNLTRSRSCPSSRHVYWPPDVPFILFLAVQEIPLQKPPRSSSRFTYLFYIILKTMIFFLIPFCTNAVTRRLSSITTPSFYPFLFLSKLNKKKTTFFF